ncbi:MULTISPECIES: type IX secretion system outer membrane channel protein PorV [Ferruginibacter]|uniref:type IX secretion system outer membrane channel protein PorV n=1 Tax=Ferruginibacter sp. SUN106 TaxID=2978348 RepID=UPI003D35BD66
MKRVTLKLTTLVVLLGGAFTVANAQSKINVVTSAVPFLRITPDARSGGMGDAGIATAPDANASFSNLAKTPFNTSKYGLAINYVPWLRDLAVNDVYLASLSGFYKISDQEAITASLRYFSLGSIQFTDGNGNDLQTYRPREFAFDAGYTRKLSSKSSLGVALRYINSNLAKGQVGSSGPTYKAGNSVAGDIHYFHHGAKENGEGFNWGATLSNLGAKISYTNDATQKDFIPANLGIGGAYTKVFDEDNKITFALDLHKLLVPTPPAIGDSAGIVKYHNKGVVSSWVSSLGDAPGGISEEIQEVNAALGIEYWYNNQFAFRAGYFYENPSKGNRKFFSVGAGLKYNVFGLNFAYLFPSGSGTSRNPLSNTYRFGLVFDFDAAK